LASASALDFTLRFFAAIFPFLRAFSARAFSFASLCAPSASRRVISSASLRAFLAFRRALSSGSLRVFSSASRRALFASWRALSISAPFLASVSGRSLVAWCASTLASAPALSRRDLEYYAPAMGASSSDSREDDGGVL